jgi:HEAT repeat protein
LGGARSGDLARNAFAHDPSYEVRAAALSALVHADPANAHAAIAVALTSHSYQDGIANAGFGSIILTNDTMFIDQVDGMASATQYPVFVLAALGGKGNTRAVDLLAKHLNDSHGVVRQWTLQAFQFTLANFNHDLAVSRLQGALDGITYADTKKAAEDLLKEMQKK